MLPRERGAQVHPLPVERLPPARRAHLEAPRVHPRRVDGGVGKDERGPLGRGAHALGEARQVLARVGVVGLQPLHAGEGGAHRRQVARAPRGQPQPHQRVHGLRRVGEHGFEPRSRGGDVPGAQLHVAQPRARPRVPRAQPPRRRELRARGVHLAGAVPRPPGLGAGVGRGVALLRGRGRGRAECRGEGKGEPWGPHPAERRAEGLRDQQTQLLAPSPVPRLPSRRVLIVRTGGPSLRPTRPAAPAIPGRPAGTTRVAAAAERW